MRVGIRGIGLRATLLGLSSLLVAVVAWAAPAAAAASSPTAPGIAAVSGIQLTPAQAAELKAKLGFLTTKNVWSEFTVSGSTIGTAHSLGAIQASHGLSAGETQTVQAILDFAAAHPVGRSAGAAPSRTVSPYLSVNGTVVFFTYSDMVAFLFTAAVAGPAALAAALDAVAWLFGGPIGGAIGVILDIIGWATIANFAYLIIQAHVLHRGVYFGIEWTPFPNYTQGTWCGCG